MIIIIIKISTQTSEAHVLQSDPSVSHSAYTLAYPDSWNMNQCRPSVERGPDIKYTWSKNIQATRTQSVCSTHNMQLIPNWLACLMFLSDHRVLVWTHHCVFEAIALLHNRTSVWRSAATWMFSGWLEGTSRMYRHLCQQIEIHAPDSSLLICVCV